LAELFNFGGGERNSHAVDAEIKSRQEITLPPKVKKG
jgi:hypothetical protein